MNRIQQPTDTTCGQTCVAMLADVSVEDVCAVMRKKGKTKASDIIKALKHYGFECGDYLIRFNKQIVLPSLAMLRLKHPHDKLTHWVVHKDGENFDPSADVCVLAYGWRIISFLEVRSNA